MLIVTILALFSAAPQASAPQLVQTAIELDVSVDYDAPAIEGRAGITLENRGSGPAGTVSLLLNRLMQFESVSAAGRQLAMEQKVRVFDDEPMLQVNQATIRLGTPVPAGGHTTIEVRFRGPLTGYTETGSLYIKDHIDKAFTIIRRDAYAFPVPGVPSYAANRSVQEPDFSFIARITVPRDQVVATGGALVAKQDTERDRTTWEYRSPGAPFLNIAVAPFTVAEADGVRINALPDDSAAGVLEATKKALALLESWYGPLDKRPSLTITEIPEGYGSQASLAGGVILDRAAFRDRAELRQLYHELSHIWNPVDLDQPSPRWNEGLATYLQYRLAAAIDGYAQLDQARTRIRTRVCDNAKRIPQLAATPMIEFGRARLTDYSYTVGFLLFTELERVMGQEAFDAGYRAYFQAHQARGGRTPELLEALEKASTADVATIWRRFMTSNGWVAESCSGSGR